MAATDISVVVPAYNEETLIQGTLDGLDLIEEILGSIDAVKR